MPHAASTSLIPGCFVRNPAAPDWGLGQIQSVVGHRVTVSFEHAGQQLVLIDRISLEPVDPDDAP